MKFSKVIISTYLLQDSLMKPLVTSPFEEEEPQMIDVTTKMSQMTDASDSEVERQKRFLALIPLVVALLTTVGISEADLQKSPLEILEGVSEEQNLPTTTEEPMEDGLLSRKKRFIVAIPALFLALRRLIEEEEEEISQIMQVITENRIKLLPLLG